MTTKTLLICATIFCITASVQAQATNTKKEPVKTTEQVSDEAIYNSVEQKPEFPGGMQKFYEYVGNNYKTPRTFKGSGKVIAQFVVEKDGSLSNVKIVKNPGLGTAEEAVRVLEKSPKWSPGVQNGRAVRVLYTLPISLQEKK